jgi:uncharacterized membrane protein
MIPTIGVMVGCYILTRMFELMAKPQQNNIVKVFSVITVLVVLASIFILIAGSGTPSPRPY